MLPLLRRCLAALAKQGGGRLRLALGLSAALALAEAGGLLLLLPLLAAAGLAQAGRLPSAWEWAAGLPLASLLAGWLAVVLVHAGLGAWRDGLGARLAEQVTAAQRSALHDAAIAMEWAAFQTERSADLTAMLSVTTLRLGHSITVGLAIAGRLAQMTAHVLVALWLAPAAASLALAVGGGLALLRRKALRQAFVGGRTQALGARAVQAMVTEHLAAVKLAKAFGAEQRHAAAFARRVARIGQSRTQLLTAQARERAWFRAGAATAMALTVWLMAAVMEVSGVRLLVLVAVFARLLPAAGDLMQQAAQVSELLGAWQQAETLLQRCLAAAEPSPTSEPPAGGALLLDGVVFRWPGRDGRAAIDGISLAIAERRVTAIVGPSGAGKSTLADLLLGLLGPAAGRLTVGGSELDAPLRAAWRRRTAVVPQDAFLFRDTIRGNLLWARPEADEADLWRVLEQAAAADMVRCLPQGLDTPLGDHGAGLSGGERQRLAIARALLRDPLLLVLDEATSHLDHDAERVIQEALQALRGRMTVVIIAHRLATIRDADHIVVLRNGRVAAAGTWPQLTTHGSGWLAEMVDAG